MIKKHPRKKSPAHLDFIRQLPCCVCGDNTSVEAAHVRFGEPLAAKRPSGMWEKPDDAWALPLCNKHHREQHRIKEKVWWSNQWPLDPIFLCLALYRVSGDVEAGCQIIREAR